MEIVTKFFAKEFSNEESKKAYLNCCKWIAENLINGDEVKDTYWNVKKVSGDLPTFRLELYVLLDEKAHRKSRCERCKEFHSLFYLNQQFNCDACNMTSYLREAEAKMAVKKQWAKERLKHQLEGD